MASPLWLVNLIKKGFPQIFVFAKITRLPGMGRLFEQLMFKGDDIIYLPGDRTVPLNTPLEGRQDLVVPSLVVEHFIRRSPHHFIMHGCICRQGAHCADYPQDLGCLFMGEAVKEINPALGRLASESEALEHVARCREAGLVHMIGRNRLDALWLNAWPEHKLLTVCNCCPCCCLWRILREVDDRIAAKVTRMPGVRITVNDHCRSCGACTRDTCFVNAISLQDGRAEIDESRCRGCGRCVQICPHGALELHFDAPDAIEASIARIARKVDLS